MARRGGVFRILRKVSPILVQESRRPGVWLLQKGEGKEPGNKSISPWPACSKKISEGKATGMFTLEDHRSPNFLGASLAEALADGRMVRALGEGDWKNALHGWNSESFFNPSGTWGMSRQGPGWKVEDRGRRAVVHGLRTEDSGLRTKS